MQRQNFLRFSILTTKKFFCLAGFKYKHPAIKKVAETKRTSYSCITDVWAVLYIPELHLGCKEDGNRGFDLLQSLHCHADKTGQIPVFHLFPSCPACS